MSPKKRPRRTAARFVALATCIADLYALDERGRVWRFDRDSNVWRPVSAVRAPAAAIGPHRAPKVTP